MELECLRRKPQKIIEYFHAAGWIQSCLAMRVDLILAFFAVWVFGTTSKARFRKSYLFSKKSDNLITLTTHGQ